MEAIDEKVAANGPSSDVSADPTCRMRSLCGSGGESDAEVARGNARRGIQVAYRRSVLLTGGTTKAWVYRVMVD
jgi:hypothetical protein